MNRDDLFEFKMSFFGNAPEFEYIELYQVGESHLDTGAKIEEHRQGCHEVTCIISGMGTIYSDNQAVDCTFGDIHIISKGVIHKIESKSMAKLHFINFAFGFTENAPKEFVEFFDNLKSIVIKDNGKIRTMLNMLVDEYYSNSSFTNEMRESLTRLILISIWRAVNVKESGYNSSSKEENKKRIVYRIMRYIEKNLSENITVTDIAQEFSYNSNYLSHLFKKQIGMPLKEYIIASKMKKAQTLLADGKSSLSEIAVLCGYDSVSSFCRTLKKHTGNTSSAYKKGLIDIEK